MHLSDHLQGGIKKETHLSEASAVMVIGVMFAAMAMAAVTFMVMLVAVAVGIGTELKISFCKCLGGCIRRSAYSCTESDSGIGKSHLGSHSDSTADEDIGMDCVEESCQSSVAVSVGVYDLLADDFSVLDIVEFELFSVSEMLEDLPVFISDCDSHC